MKQYDFDEIDAVIDLYGIPDENLRAEFKEYVRQNFSEGCDNITAAIDIIKMLGEGFSISMILEKLHDYYNKPYNIYIIMDIVLKYSLRGATLFYHYINNNRDGICKNANQFPAWRKLHTSSMLKSIPHSLLELHQRHLACFHRNAQIISDVLATTGMDFYDNFTVEDLFNNNASILRFFRNLPIIDSTEFVKVFSDLFKNLNSKHIYVENCFYGLEEGKENAQEHAFNELQEYTIYTMIIKYFIYILHKISVKNKITSEEMFGEMVAFVEYFEFNCSGCIFLHAEEEDKKIDKILAYDISKLDDIYPGFYELLAPAIEKANRPILGEQIDKIRGEERTGSGGNARR